MARLLPPLSLPDFLVANSSCGYSALWKRPSFELLQFQAPGPQGVVFLLRSSLLGHKSITIPKLHSFVVLRSDPSSFLVLVPWLQACLCASSPTPAVCPCRSLSSPSPQFQLCAIQPITFITRPYSSESWVITDLLIPFMPTRVPVIRSAIFPSDEYLLSVPFSVFPLMLPCSRVQTFT